LSLLLVPYLERIAHGILRAQARMTAGGRPAGLSAALTVVRRAIGGWSARWSKIISQPVASPSPSR